MAILKGDTTIGGVNVLAAIGGSSAAKVTFTAASWLNGELAIPASQHGRTSANFVYSIRQQVGGSQVTNTWAILETGISYDAGTIRLKSAYSYAGEIIFSN